MTVRALESVAISRVGGFGSTVRPAVAGPAAGAPPCAAPCTPLLQANELSISLVAAIPAFFIAGGSLYYLGR